MTQHHENNFLDSLHTGTWKTKNDIMTQHHENNFLGSLHTSVLNLEQISYLNLTKSAGSAQGDHPFNVALSE